MTASLTPLFSSVPCDQRHAQVAPGPGLTDSSATSAGSPAELRGEAGRPALVALVSNRAGVAVPLPKPGTERRTRSVPIAAPAPELGAAVRVAGEPALRTAGAAADPFVKGNAYAMPHAVIVAPARPRPIIAPPPVEAPGKPDPAMQRPSDPQQLAVALDEVLPLVIDKLEADGERDAGDEHIIRTLRAVSDGQLRHAEIFDLTASINRIGLTKRNRQKVRELFPELGA